MVSLASSSNLAPIFGKPAENKVLVYDLAGGLSRRSVTTSINRARISPHGPYSPLGPVPSFSGPELAIKGIPNRNYPRFVGTERKGHRTGLISSIHLALAESFIV